MIKSFILYTDWEKLVKRLSLEERGKLITAVFDYAKGNTTDVTLSGEADMLLEVITMAIDRDKDKYEDIVEKRREAGKLGNLKRWGDKSQMRANGSKCSQKVASIADNVNDSDSDSVNDNVSDSVSVCVYDTQKSTHTQEYINFISAMAMYFPNVSSYIPKQLTEDEYYTLINKYGSDKLRTALNQLDNKIDNKCKYKSVYRTLTTWIDKL